MLRIESKKTDYFQFNNFSESLGIKHFISSRIKKSNNIISNNFNISLESDMPENEVIKNRRILSETVDIPLKNFVIQNQIHSDNITIINKKQKGRGISNHSNAIQNSDAMITDKKNICLFLFAADCMPILFYDTKKQVIAVTHSGWKGTVLKIAQKTVSEMIKIYKSNPEDIIAGIGPSISVKNYEVGKNVVEAVEKAFGTKENYLQFNQNTKKYHFDLWYTAKKQLIEVGIPDKNIELSKHCTFEDNDIFFSARQKNTGRFSAGIMLV